ncbi:MAG: sigma-70 family RNA polymerase sigma factor [Clostridium sp.]|uniref:sigma-70 family RNA polymerase sigma factor n=1 Tax=Anaerorhabdus sp. TaxID=1872524 RepID=UPI002FC8273A
MKSEEFKGLEVDILQAKNGSMEAKERIIKRYANYVYTEAFKIRIPNFDIEDMIQIGTFTILKCIISFNQDKSKNFTSYVTRAIKNNYLDLLLKEQRRHGKNTSDEMLVEVADAISIEDNVLMSIEVSTLHKAFKNLTIGEAELISQLYFQEASIKEIAADLNVSYTTIYRRKNKALNVLMSSLASEISV